MPLPTRHAAGWGNNELQNYTSRWVNVRVAQGTLILQAQVSRQQPGWRMMEHGCRVRLTFLPP